MSTLALKGPYWATVRQHRRAAYTLAGAVLLSLLAVLAMLAWDSRSADAATARSALRVGMDYASMGMILLPGLVGVFVAGPLIARELESGTYTLAWTQSVTPARWLASKLLTAGAMAVLGALALIGVYRIGYARVEGAHQFHWADRGPYEATGTVLVAYVLLAVAVGALLGLLIRRTVVAMAATGGVLGLVLLVLGAVRWDFLPVQTITGPVGKDAAPLMGPGNSFMMDSGMLARSGERLPEWTCWERTQNPTDCPADLNITGQYLDYHPESHFWLTQLIETGIVLALAALALFVAFRALRGRHG